MWLAEYPPEKNTASRKSAEKVGQPAEYNKKIRLVGLVRSKVEVELELAVVRFVVCTVLGSVNVGRNTKHSQQISTVNSPSHIIVASQTSLATTQDDRQQP